MEIPADTWHTHTHTHPEKQNLNFFKAEPKLGSVKELILLKIHVHLKIKARKLCSILQENLATSKTK